MNEYPNTMPYHNKSVHQNWSKSDISARKVYLIKSTRDQLSFFNFPVFSRNFLFFHRFCPPLSAYMHTHTHTHTGNQTSVFGITLQYSTIWNTRKLPNLTSPTQIWRWSCSCNSICKKCSTAKNATTKHESLGFISLIVQLK